LTAFFSRRWPLLVALAIGLALRLLVALNHPIDYNGFWHVFIARNLSREYYGLAHPPLFLVLLKAIDAVSQSRVAYQGVSILAGLGTIVCVHRILEKLKTSAGVAFLGALTMAVAQPAVFLSREVQSYMLAIFFILASFVYYLDIVGVGTRPSGWKPRAAFAILASLALLTEYFAGLYLVAAVLAPLLVAVFRPLYRRGLLQSLRRRFLPDFATLLPPLAVAVALYELIAKPWLHRLNHLPEFYFVPGTESAAAFLTRNLWNLFNLFSPAILWSPRRAAALVLGFAVIAFLVAVTQRRRDADGEARAMPGAVLLVLLAIGIALGLAGLYPFGGAMRQQFLYFPFLVLAGFVALDRALGYVPSGAQKALLALGVVVLAVAVAAHWQNLRRPGRDPFMAQGRAFDRALPDASVVQADQFNLIGFFIPHHDWKWRYAGTLPGLPAVQRYELEKNGRRLTLLAHRTRWNFDVVDPKSYAAFRAAADAAGARCTSVFDVHQNLYKPAERKLPHLEAEVVEPQARALATAEGLFVGRMAIRGDDVFMEICETKPCGLLFLRFADQDRILARLPAAKLCGLALSPGDVPKTREPGFLQASVELLAIVEPLVAPPVKRDVEHLGACLDELVVRPRQPVLVAPVARADPFQHEIERGHREAKHAVRGEHAPALAKERHAVLGLHVLEQMLGIDEGAGVVRNRKAERQIPDEVRRAHGGIGVDVDPPREGNAPATDVELVRRLREASHGRLRRAALGGPLPGERLSGTKRSLADHAVEKRKANSQVPHPSPEVRVATDSRLPRLGVVTQRLEVRPVENRGMHDVARSRRHRADPQPLLLRALKLARAVHELGILLRGETEELLQVILDEHVVVVEISDPFAARELERAIGRRRPGHHPAMEGCLGVRAPLAEVLEPDPRVSESRDPRSRVVGAGVADDDRFPVRVSLAHERRERSRRQQLRAVPGRRQDADEGAVGPGLQAPDETAEREPARRAGVTRAHRTAARDRRRDRGRRRTDR
jgi:hypothetical protein